MRRATEAQQLLSNPLLQGAFVAAESAYIQQMRQVDLKDTEMHTRLVLALQISNAVARHLWLLIQEGEVAADQLNFRGRRID